jgi:penicillin-binding protein 1A
LETSGLLPDLRVGGMQSTCKEPVSSIGPVSGAHVDAPYEALHEVTPFGMETLPPEPQPSPPDRPSDGAPPTAPQFSLTARLLATRLAARVKRTVLWMRWRSRGWRSIPRNRLDWRNWRRPSQWTFRLKWPSAPNWPAPPPLTEAERIALRRRRQRRALVELGFWLILAAGMVALVVAALVSYYAMVLPDPRLAGLSRMTPNITIRSADGEIVAERGMRRGYVTLDQIPRHLINAVIATEDRRFHYHFGFDLVGLCRAAYINWRTGDVVQGGSTLTQQLAKNLFLEPKRHWSRKFEELVLALWLEVKFTKDQIMELYLNRVYFGSGNYGVEAAAHHYFGKPTRELTLPEAALLTGLIKAPSSLSPARNPDGAQERAGLVLKNMLDGLLIGEKDYRFALGHPAQIRAKEQASGFDYLVDWIAELIPSLVGESDGNFIVRTTIDARLQRDVDAIVHRKFVEQGRDLSASEAAVVLLSPDGAVKTLVGGLDYDANQFNRAVKGRRQPGSAFKPFIYLAALEAGMTPSTTVEDAPILVGDWRPQNYNGAYRGTIPLKTALAVSSNAAAVRLMDQVGRNKVIDVAQKLGIYSNLERGPTLALGTAEVTPLELTAAYATFANEGRAVLPYVIESVLDDHDRTLYAQSHARTESVVSADHVGEMNDMLNAAVVSGTGRRASLSRHQAAGKTGTTQRFNDAWFVGYTAQWVGGVWVGNDRRLHMRHVTGGTLPAEIWKEIMLRSHEGLKPKPLPGVQPPSSRSTPGPADPKKHQEQHQEQHPEPGAVRSPEAAPPNHT